MRVRLKRDRRKKTIELTLRAQRGERVSQRKMEALVGCEEPSILRPVQGAGVHMDRGITYRSAECATLRDALRTCAVDADMVACVCQSLLSALTWRSEVGMQGIGMIFDPRFVLVEREGWLRMVCVPLDGWCPPAEESPLRLLRALADVRPARDRTPDDLVASERLASFVRCQDGVFSLNGFRAFVRTELMSNGPPSAAPREGRDARGALRSGGQGRGLSIVAEGSGKRFVLAPGEQYVLGRSESCEVCLGGRPKVSRTHARLRCDGRTLLLTDLASTNGTYVEGIRVAPHEGRSVGIGQVFSIAGERFVVEENEEGAW